MSEQEVGSSTASFSNPRDSVPICTPIGSQAPPSSSPPIALSQSNSFNSDITSDFPPASIQFKVPLRRSTFAEHACAENAEKAEVLDEGCLTGPVSVILKELKAIVNEVRRLRPYAVPHKQKTTAWQKVLSILHDAGYYTETPMEKWAKVRKDLRDLIQFKEGLTDSEVEKLFGEKHKAKPTKKRRFPFDTEQLADGLASNLEFIADDLEKVVEDKGTRTADKKRSEDEEHRRGELLRRAATKGRVNVSSLEPSLSDQPLEPYTVDPHRYGTSSQSTLSTHASSTHPRKLHRLNDGRVEKIHEPFPESHFSTPIPSAGAFSNKSTKTPVPVTLLPSLFTELTRAQTEVEMANWDRFNMSIMQLTEETKKQREVMERMEILMKELVSIMGDTRSILQLQLKRDILSSSG